MRLLCTTKLQVLDVPDDAVPPYAILSHTWGKDEVSFQDLCVFHKKQEQQQKQQQQGQQSNGITGGSEEDITAKGGFAKVRDSAALAKNRGFSRIWIDTCCIDKTSSAELSEAINSMYRWYAEARECYAYLWDVEGGRLSDADGGQEKIATGFATSRWFTRGWTLQELIAPHTVFFYDKAWQFLGNKSDGKMPLVLSMITGMDKDVLAGRMQPGDLSVASRMQWAADRKTTRTEDLAYCMMGVFDVNMPLLYGEGTKAFTRLQEEILRVTDDQSIFAWALPDIAGDGSSEDICGLLATHPRQFKDIRSMNPLPPLWGRESVPSSFTNQGLRVQLQLRHVGEVTGLNTSKSVAEEYIAILDCSVTTGISHFWPALHLQRLWNDQFARIRPDVCRYLPAPAVAGSEYQVVYIKQKPKHVIPELFVPVSAPDHSISMVLEDVHPTTRWNPHSMTLKSVLSSGNGVMGAFRFKQNDGMEEKVDVIVGIRPSEFQLKTRQVTWEAWCFQRRCSGQELRDVFESWDKILLESTRSRPSLVEYQYLYGEDHRLLSSASVVETMMFGRVFFSVQVLKRQELGLNELVPWDAAHLSNGNDEAIEGPSLEDMASELTGPCFTTTFFAEKGARLANGVRTRERYNSNRLSLVSGLKAQPGMAEDPSKPKGAVEMEPLNSRLLEACRRGDYDKAKLMLRRWASPNCYTRQPQVNPWGFPLEGLTPLHWAIISKSNNIIGELMSEGANIMAESSGGWNALHFLALKYNNEERLPNAISEKLKKMAEGDLTSLTRRNVSVLLETPLHFLCGRADGNMQLFDILVGDDPGVSSDRNIYGELPLHRAAAAGNIHAVASFASNRSMRAILDKQDEELRTPVWHAAGARPQSLSISRAMDPLLKLLEAGASANLADNLGRTPLHIACREGRAEAVEMLLDHGAYAASPSAYFSMTPYHFAALFQNERCLQVLMEKRPQTLREFDQPTDGECSFTPLHLAAANGWQSGVMMLVGYGADLQIGCSHFIRKGVDAGAMVDDSNTQSVPELFEMPSDSVYDLVTNILDTGRHDDRDEPKLKEVRQFVRRQLNEKLSKKTTKKTTERVKSNRPVIDEKGAIIDLTSYGVVRL